MGRAMSTMIMRRPDRAIGQETGGVVTGVWPGGVGPAPPR